MADEDESGTPETPDHVDPEEAGEPVASGDAYPADPPGLTPTENPEAAAPTENLDAEASLHNPEAAVPAEPRSARHAKKKQKKPKHRAPWWELPALIALAIAIAILVKTFLFQPFYIPSASMEKTLHGSSELGHDRILVNKIIYDFRDPEPGDIVVFSAPPGWNEIHSTPPSNPILHGIRWFGQLVGFVPPDTEVLVKRVIATGGQTVQGFDKNGRSEVHITDAKGKVHVLNEPYVWSPTQDSHAAFGPIKVPSGRLWVMGDHRSDSQDSRYHCASGGGDGDFGAACDPTSSTVPIDDVIGKAFIVAWPPSHWRTLGTPSTFDHLADTANAAFPSGVGVLAVLPIYLLRRRRRRR